MVHGGVRHHLAALDALRLAPAMLMSACRRRQMQQHLTVSMVARTSRTALEVKSLAETPSPPPVSPASCFSFRVQATSGSFSQAPTHVPPFITGSTHAAVQGEGMVRRQRPKDPRAS